VKAGPAGGGENAVAGLTREAPAKLNLRLRVLEQDAAGYHGVETLLIRLRLADRITVRSADPGIRLEVLGDPSVPASEGNLCWRAADMLHRELKLEPAVSIRLEKRIPTAAGLGGGSMDAAAVLLALTALPGLGMERERLVELAGELGSDVPFGVCGAEFALGWERGRRLIPLQSPPSRPVLVAVPPFGVRAADAYDWLRRDREQKTSGSEGATSRPGAGLLPAPEALTDWSVLSGLASNDLEAPVFRRHPELGVIRNRLKELGARISILCGSGGCVAGIYDSAEARDLAARILESEAGVRSLRTATRDGESG
jgi:4-diphosphocytidyl-2-C-methyl-D-erythritol kinase